MTGLLHPQLHPHQEGSSPQEVTVNDGERAVGVPQERVDPHTLAVIDALFPGHRGLDFLARLLRLAEAKQLALPELLLPELCDVAVITVQSLRTLARLIGFSYDTTEKYVVVLCQLRLLQKKRSRRQIALHFPLCRRQLPEPEVLDQLADYRPKVRSFARAVKRRFIVLLSKRGALAPALPRGSAHTEPLPIEALLEDIRRILSQEKVDSETGSRLYLKIAGALQYRCQFLNQQAQESSSRSESPFSPADVEDASDRERRSSSHSPTGDFFDQAAHSVAPVYTKKSPGASWQSPARAAQLGVSNTESRPLEKTGDFPQAALSQAVQQRRPSGQKGDLLQIAPDPPEASIGKSRHFSKKGDVEASRPGVSSLQKSPDLICANNSGDFSEKNQGQQSRPFSKKGDSDAREPGVFPPQKSPEPGQKGDFDERVGERVARILQPSEQTGDSLTQKGDSDTGEQALNVNVSLKNILLLLNVNVKPVIEHLRILFGDPPGKRGYYYHLYKQCQDASVWLAAVIETLLAVHRSRTDAVTNPGGYFYKRCLTLLRGGIPPETQRQVALYSSLSYPQLLNALHAGAGTSGADSAKGKGGQPVKPGWPGRSAPYKMTRRIPRPSKRLSALSASDFKQLTSQLQAGEHTREMRLLAYRQDDGTILALLEDFAGRQRWIASLAEWSRLSRLIRRSLLPSTKTPHPANPLKKGDHR